MTLRGNSAIGGAAGSFFYALGRKSTTSNFLLAWLNLALSINKLKTK